MTEYHVAHLTFETHPKGKVGYAFPGLKQSCLFGSRAVRSPSVSLATVVDTEGRVVVEFLPEAKDTYTWGPSPVAKGYSLTIS